MQRQLSTEREREFQELLRYLEFLLPTIRPSLSQSPGSFRARVAEIEAEFGRSKALEGLRQAANDTVEMLFDRKLDDIVALDAVLRGAGVLTLSEVRRRYSSTLAKVLKRGTIRSDTEYYLVAGILTDQSSLINDAERERLELLVQVYLDDA